MRRCWVAMVLREERNAVGKMMEIVVVNTYNNKREEHKVTLKSGGSFTWVNWIKCWKLKKEES